MNISSIGFKLVTVIILIVLVSLSAVTTLEFWLIQQDMLFSAQRINFETNRLFTEKTRETFVQIRSDTALLAQMIDTMGTGSNSAMEVIEFFFDQNPGAAALYFAPDEVFVNRRFFLSRAVDSSLVDIFLNDRQDILELAEFGETIVINAAPDFAINLLALFFPGKTGAQMALFSSDGLSGSVGFGIHQTYILNDSGDLLMHEDYEIIRSGLNVADYGFVRDIMESPNIYRQSLVEADFGVFAEAKKNNFLLRFNKFFDRVKETAIFAFSKTGQFFKSVYNKCADGIFNLLDKERKASRKIIVVETYNTSEPVEEAPPSVRQFVAYTKMADFNCIVITGVEYDEILKENAGISKRFLFLAGGVLCFSIILVWFFVRSVFLQQKVLAEVANQIEPVSGNIRTRDLLVILLCIIGIIAFFSLFRLSLPKTAGLFEEQADSIEDFIIEQDVQEALAVEKEDDTVTIEQEFAPVLAAVKHEPEPLSEHFFQPALAAMPETALLSAVHITSVSEQLFPAPENMIPYQGYHTDIESLRNLKNLRFNWSEVTGADGYIFSLYQQTVSGRRLITRTTVEYRTGWILDNLNVLSRGTFIWQVEAIKRGRTGSIDRRGKQAENAFIVE